MRLVRVLPAAEHVVDREQGYLGELFAIPGQRGLGARTIEISAREVLSLIGVKKIEIRFGHSLGAAFLYDFLHQSHGRLGQNADGRSHDLVFLSAEFLEREIRFIFPSDQNVADAALDEGGGRAAGAGIEHGHIL